MPRCLTLLRLQRACRRGHSKAVDKCLAALVATTSQGDDDHNASTIDSTFDNRSTALISASAAGSVPIIRKLLKAKASVNVRTPTGMTALRAAYESAVGSAMRYLLRKGANSNERYLDKPVFCAMRLQTNATHSKCITPRLLLDFVSKCDVAGLAPLLCAARTLTGCRSCTTPCSTPE